MYRRSRRDRDALWHPATQTTCVSRIHWVKWQQAADSCGPIGNTYKRGRCTLALPGEYRWTMRGGAAALCRVTLSTCQYGRCLGRQPVVCAARRYNTSADSGPISRSSLQILPTRLFCLAAAFDLTSSVCKSCPPQDDYNSTVVLIVICVKQMPGERDNARNNVRCTQARKTTHGLDGQHQDVDRTLRGTVSQNERGQR